MELMAYKPLLEGWEGALEDFGENSPPKNDRSKLLVRVSQLGEGMQLKLKKIITAHCRFCFNYFEHWNM